MAALLSFACKVPGETTKPQGMGGQTVAKTENTAVQVTVPSNSSLTPHQEGHPMLAGKPLFSLRLDIERCAHDVYVNGGLITRNLDGTPAHAEYPVNHWLRSGANDIQIFMMKWEGDPDECDVKAEINWKEERGAAGAAPVKLLTLAHDAKLATPADPAPGSSASGTFDARTGSVTTPSTGDLRVTAASVTRLTGKLAHIHVLSRSFEVSLPFPEWAFFRGEVQMRATDFESKEARRPVYNELFAAYEKLRDMLARRDVDAFLDACEERSREIDIAYYKRPGDTRASLRRDVESALNNPALELATFDRVDKGMWGYLVGSKGTLVTLYQGNRASTILRFPMKDGSAFSVILPVFFRRENGKYIVTR
jgi:hypothetical protein